METSRSSGLERNYAAHGRCSNAIGSQTTLTPLFKIFHTIPPERVGLHGEYDHNGLAKRVALAFSQQFAPDTIANLRITQRGTVVVLVGRAINQRTMNCLISVALGVSGAADVEVNGVSVIKPLQVPTSQPEPGSSASQACWG